MPKYDDTVMIKFLEILGLAPESKSISKASISYNWEEGGPLEIDLTITDPSRLKKNAEGEFELEEIKEHYYLCKKEEERVKHYCLEVIDSNKVPIWCGLEEGHDGPCEP